MKPFFICFWFLFYTLRGGYVKPFLYSFSFVLYVTRWVCATLLIYFCYCFMCYDVGMLNPLYIF